jgi:hypothetical protein
MQSRLAGDGLVDHPAKEHLFLRQPPLPAGVGDVDLL